MSSGTPTGLYDLRKSEGVVRLSFQHCDTPKDVVPDIERIITGICAFHYAIAGMQTSVSEFATLIRVTETNGCVGGQC